MSYDDAAVHRMEVALQHGGLYVDPALAAKVPPATQAQIRAAIAQQHTPFNVLIVQIPYDDELYHGDPEALIGAIHSDTGQNGVFIAANLSSTLAPSTSVFGDYVDDYSAAGLAQLRHPNDAGAQVLATIREWGRPGNQDTYEKLLAKRDQNTARTQAAPTHQSDGHGTVWGAGGGIVALLVLAAVVARVRRNRTRSVRGPGAELLTERPFRLPATVLGTITETRDREREQQAQAEVLALGEAIDGATMAPGSAGASAWQAALDHYDLARRILDRQHGPADVVGALVLARRGTAALAAAKTGADWTPTPTCYLNPLHGAARGETTWRGDHGDAAVPMCAACAKAVKAGHEPHDVLDFMDHGRPRHYFDLDLGVWSRTGYGSLDTDLTGTLFST